jgi:antitoxin component YwqK of YwqJK toxin-antitoxin module
MMTSHEDAVKARDGGDGAIMGPMRRDLTMPSQPTSTRDIAYYDDGGVRYRGFQLDGEMHAEWEFFRKDGTLMRSGSFDRGKQVGTWKTFDRTGRVVKETDFGVG